MVSFKQARKLVMEKAVTLGQEIIKLDGAFGRIVAEDIHSKNPVPPFRNSAVDGYAVRSLDIKGQIGQVRLKLVAKQPAGDYYGKKNRPEPDGKSNDRSPGATCCGCSCPSRRS